MSSSARRSAASASSSRPSSRSSWRPHRVPQVESGQRILERVDLGERRRRPLDPGERDGAVEPHHRRPVVREQHVVEGQHLQPVGRRRVRGVRVARRDRRVQLPAARPAQRGGALERPRARRRGARHPIATGPARRAARARRRPRGRTRGRGGTAAARAAPAPRPRAAAPSATTRASHSASSARSRSAAASPPGDEVRLAVHHRDDGQHDVEPLGAAPPPSGTRSGMPAAPILRLARDDPLRRSSASG